MVFSENSVQHSLFRKKYREQSNEHYPKQKAQIECPRHSAQSKILGFFGPVAKSEKLFLLNLNSIT
jgi:hypothetical protein